MKIIRKPKFILGLIGILNFIRWDNRSAAILFEQNLSKKIGDLIDYPLKYKASQYFNNKSYRDMIFKDYTVIYKVEKTKILILDIFKWQNK